MEKEIKRGEIYYTNLSPVLGSEQDGNRPVLIIQNNIGNHYSPTTIVAAITSKMDKSHLPTHIKFRADGLNGISLILLEQIRTIDKQRIGDYVGEIDEETMKRVEDAIRISLALNYSEVLKDERC